MYRTEQDITASNHLQGQPQATFFLRVESSHGPTCIQNTLPMKRIAQKAIAPSIFPFLSCSLPSYNSRLCVGLMLDHHLRQWSSIKPTQSHLPEFFLASARQMLGLWFRHVAGRRDMDAWSALSGQWWHGRINSARDTVNMATRGWLSDSGPTLWQAHPKNTPPSSPSARSLSCVGQDSRVA